MRAYFSITAHKTSLNLVILPLHSPAFSLHFGTFQTSSLWRLCSKIVPKYFLAVGGGGIFRENKNTAVISRYWVACAPTKWAFDSKRRKQRASTGAADPVRYTARNEENGGSVLVELCRRASLPVLENIVKGFASMIYSGVYPSRYIVS